MEAIEWFFSLHDKDKDGFLTKDEVLQLSESLLVRTIQTFYDIELTTVSPLVHISVRGRRRVSRRSQPFYDQCI